MVSASSPALSLERWEIPLKKRPDQFSTSKARLSATENLLLFPLFMTKNIALYAVACIMYLATGYALMYDGGFFLQGIEAFDLNQVLADSAENGFDGGSVYSGASDFFFQVVFVATAMSIVSGAVAERMKLWSFLVFAMVLTGFIYPMEGSWTWGGKPVFGMFTSAILGSVISPAPVLFTWPVRQQRWPACFCWVRERASMERMVKSSPYPAPICRWQPLARLFSGWAGLVSTVAPYSNWQMRPMPFGRDGVS